MIPKNILGSPARFGATFCLFSMLAIAFLSGCQFSPKRIPKGWSWGGDEKSVLPDRILAVWTDTVLHQPNQPGVRGFGGRIFFYEKDNNDPIEVNGSLAIYVFDADDDDPENQRPVRKYLYTAEEFAGHMSKTTIGPSYSVWLPWGDVSGPQQRLSIIARFEGTKGGTTISDPTIKLLPGVNKSKRDSAGTSAKLKSQPTDKELTESPDKAEKKSEGVVQQAGFQVPTTRKVASSNEDASMAGTLQTEEGSEDAIELPPSFGRHLKPGAEPAIQSPAGKSQVVTQVFDSRSDQLDTFKQNYREPSGSIRGRSKSTTSRLQQLRGGKWIEGLERNQGPKGNAELQGGG